MKQIFNNIKNIDSSIVKVMNHGFKFSFILCIISTYVLYLYILTPSSHMLFDVGYCLVKCSIMFFVCFFVGALASDRIKRELF